MKVILIEDLKGTGKKGEVVEVKEGYGRNFLIPKGLALAAIEGNVARLEHMVKSLANKKMKELKTAEDIKARLEEIDPTSQPITGIAAWKRESVTAILEAFTKSIFLKINPLDTETANVSNERLIAITRMVNNSIVKV